MQESLALTLKSLEWLLLHVAPKTGSLAPWSCRVVAGAVVVWDVLRVYLEHVALDCWPWVQEGSSGVLAQ